MKRKYYISKDSEGFAKIADECDARLRAGKFELKDGKYVGTITVPDMPNAVANDDGRAPNFKAVTGEDVQVYIDSVLEKFPESTYEIAAAVEQGVYLYLNRMDRPKPVSSKGEAARIAAETHAKREMALLAKYPNDMAVMGAYIAAKDKSGFLTSKGV